MVSSVRLTTVALAAILVTLSVLSAACSRAAESPQAAAPAAATGVAPSAPSGTQAVTENAQPGGTAGSPAQAAPGRASASATRAAAPRRQPATSTRARGADSSASTPGATPDLAVANTRSVDSTQGDETPRGQAIVLPDRASSRIYSKDDREVVPPKLLYSQVSSPLFRNNRPDVNTMELIISEDGTVEQVKLLSDPKRMTDMMLLSGAKTWRFDPARREGTPVRYRLVFMWEATP